MTARILGCLGLVVLGAVIGLAGAFVQADRALVQAPWGLLVIPWGVALVWVCLLSAIRAGAWLLWTRWGAWSVLAGWLAMTVVMSADSPSGDLALSGGGRQLTYLLGGVILGSAAATLRVSRGGTGARNPGRRQSVNEDDGSAYDPSIGV